MRGNKRQRKKNEKKRLARHAQFQQGAKALGAVFSNAICDTLASASFTTMAFGTKEEKLAEYNRREPWWTRTELTELPEHLVRKRCCQFTSDAVNAPED